MTSFEGDADMNGNDCDVLFSALDARRRGAVPLFELFAWVTLQEKIAVRVSSLHRASSQLPSHHHHHHQHANQINANNLMERKNSIDLSDEFSLGCGLPSAGKASLLQSITSAVSLAASQDTSNKSTSSNNHNHLLAQSWDGIEIVELILTRAVEEIHIVNTLALTTRNSRSSTSSMVYDSAITSNGGWLPQAAVEQLLSGICTSVEAEILISQLLVAMFGSGSILRKPCFLRGYSTHPNHHVVPQANGESIATSHFSNTGTTSTGNGNGTGDGDSGLSLLHVLCVSVTSIVEYCKRQKQHQQEASSSPLQKTLPILVDVIAEQMKCIVSMLIKDK